MATISGKLNAADLRFAIVVARFNHFITDRLLEGAVDLLTRSGAARTDIDIVHVPGAFEIPLIAQELALQPRYDAVICLGAVIRGATAHFDLVAGECARGVLQAGLNAGKPVIFGVLTTDTIEQAIERAGTKAGNKGAESAQCAIELVDVLRQMQQLSASKENTHE